MRFSRLWSLVFAAALLSGAVWGQDDPPQPEKQPAKDNGQEKTAPEQEDQDKKAEKEEREAAKEIEDARRAFRIAMLQQNQRVWIERRNATIFEIVQDFRKQAGANIIVQPENIPEDYRVREFVVRGAPFREAFDHFLKLTELEILEETTTIIRIGRPVRMSLSVTDTDIKTVLTLIAKVANANIVMAPERITGKVTLTVNNVPWNAILENVVKALSYTTVREEYDVIRVISQEELTQQMDVKVYKLKYIQPPPTYRAKFEENKFVDGEPLRPMTSPEDIERFFPFLKLVEASLTTDARGQPLGKAIYDSERNAIIVRDTKPVLDRITKVVGLLDTEPDMVMLSMKFLSTRNEDLLNWGTAWFGIDQLGGAVEGIGVVSRTTPFDDPLAGTTQLSGATQQILGRLPFGIGSSDPAIKPNYFLTEYDQRVLFRAFKRDQYTKLLQEPTLSVLDGTDATIFVGEEVPFAVSKLIVVPGAPTQQSIEPGPGSPIKIGFQVLVQPRILKDQGQVILTVIPQNIVLSGSDSELPGFERFTFGTQEIVLPRTAETTMVSRLKIDDNQTAVLGGLVVERVSLTERGIPGLKDIPVLNFLFKDKTESKTKEHLLIFITPKIVRNRAEMARQLDAQRRLKAAEIERDLQRLRRLRKSTGSSE